MNNRLTELIDYLIGERLINNDSDFASRIGKSRSTISDIKNNKRTITEQIADSIIQVFPEVNKYWLMFGDGEMLQGSPPNFNETTQNESIPIKLLPLYAQGGTLNDFTMGVTELDCETIISPIGDVDFAITVNGDSMYPEYPSGSKILIKKINEKAFIEWGKTYVLDTCNGVIIKEIHKSNIDECVTCVSINDDPKYAPFDVNMHDIYGMYRVVLMMSPK